MLWSVSGKGVPPSYSSIGKHVEAPDHFASLQFDIPSVFQVPSMTSLGFSADPGALLQAATASVNPTTINLINQATAIGDGLNSNWEATDVSIQGGDAVLDVVNDGYSSLGQWAQTVQETEFAQAVEEFGTLLEAVEQELEMEMEAIELMDGHDQAVMQEEEAVVVGADAVLVLDSDDEEEKDIEEEVVMVVPIIAVQVPLTPLQPQPLNIEEIPSISIQIGPNPPEALSILSPPEAVIVQPETEPEVAEAVAPPQLAVEAVAPPQMAVETAPPHPEAPAPSPSTTITMIEHVPLPEYGWYPSQSVTGFQNTGASQIMSMNLQGNLVDVNGTQNVNVHVATLGSGSTSSVQLLGETLPPGTIGLGNSNKAPGGGGNEPSRVTIQLREPAKGKPIVYQLNNYADNHF
ncbi:unnamed protein product [Orchesella dallaii]|uniref:Uncharacterized protein n=1 Tax=Orchesella dallaii TaxID=48710 RepID=A0ABP1S0U3_9HEXA